MGSRRGGPRFVISPLGIFDFTPDSRKMRVRSLHQGVTLEQVRDQTGFDMICDERPAVTLAPEGTELVALREQVDREGVLASKFPWSRV